MTLGIHSFGRLLHSAARNGGLYFVVGYFELQGALIEGEDTHKNVCRWLAECGFHVFEKQRLVSGSSP